jgi:hypothetical protein
MVKKLKELIRRYVFSENLPMDARMINMVCFVGLAAAIIATLVRIIMRLDWKIILVMLCISFSVVLILYLCNRFRLYTFTTWIMLIMLSDVLFPLAFFYLGGADSGMAAFFVLSIVAIFFLCRGLPRVVLIVTHVIWVSVCYVAAYYYPNLVTRLSPLQQTMDNIHSFLVSGFFSGCVILFQNKIFVSEKKKVDRVAEELIYRGKLLSVVNEAAVVLLSSGEEDPEAVLRKGMEMIGLCIDIDRINIWKNINKEDGLYYRRIYSWTREAEEFRPLEFAYHATFPGWEGTLSSGGYINGPVQRIGKIEWVRLEPFGVKSVLIIPVFVEDRFWGFISFDDCRK